MNVNFESIEKAVLSSFLFDNTEFFEYGHTINTNDFVLPYSQEIFQTMQYLHEHDMPLEETFILKYANKEKLREQDLISVMAVNAISNVHSYIELLKQESSKRKLLQLSIQMHKDLSSDSNMSIEDVKSNIVHYIDNLDNVNIDKYEHKSSDLVSLVQKQMENAQNKDLIQKYYTGLKALDNILDGIDDGDLIVIAGRPSMGKTSLIASICIESLQNNNGVLIESLEMPADKIMKRLLAVKSEENLKDIKNGLVKNLSNFKNASEFFSKGDLIIHDETYPTLYQLQAKIKRTLRKNPNIKNVFIDHTGKIQLDGKTREDIEIGKITNTLKKIARDYGIRVFLLQQLNRGVENRENKRPTLSDIKNSGNVEEDADVVLGLYRSSYYKSKENETYENNLEESEIIVLKNRDGALGTAKVWFERKITAFKNKTTFEKESLIKF